MKQIRSLSEFCCLSEYTRIDPTFFVPKNGMELNFEISNIR